MSMVLLSEAKGKRLAEKYGIDKEKVRGVWHRGDRRQLLFYMVDGTVKFLSTGKQNMTETAFDDAIMAEDVKRWLNDLRDYNINGVPESGPPSHTQKYYSRS